ncbi:MAG TPA: MMPL family transporter [Micromonosporaceae bacterium]|nr:MMPL family transporter [Micromonosporaceae bacterium]
MATNSSAARGGAAAGTSRPARMNSPTGRGAIAAVGRACFRFRWLVVVVWVAIAVAGFLASGPVSAGLSDEPGANSLESVQGDNILNNQSQVGPDVLGEVTGVDPTTADVRAAVLASAASIGHISGVRSVATPYDAGVPAAQSRHLLANDGRGLLVDVTLADLDDAPQKTAVDAVSKQLDALGTTLRARAPDARVLLGGDAVLNDQVNKQVSRDLSLAEGLSLPLTLVVLVFVFGGLLAAGIPVIAAILSVFAGMLGLLGFEHITNIDDNATIVVTLLGLGLSIDYGLLLVARYREELAHGYAPEQAIGRAWSTAGRTIAFSALTVAGSLCGLIVFGVTSMTALGVAGVSIAAVAMLVALTGSAALIGFARKRIRPSKRALARAARHAARTATPIARAYSADGTDRDLSEKGFFAGLARMVQRRPLVTFVATALVLLAMGLPLLGTTTHIGDVKGLPPSLSSVQVANDLSSRYGRPSDPAVIVLARTNPGPLNDWATRFEHAPGVVDVTPATQVGPGLSTVQIYVAGDPEGTAGRKLVGLVRADRPAGVQSWVTGNAALLDDILGLIGQRLPLAIAVTVVAMFVLLFLMTGSLVVPLKAIVMNMLSLGATVGVMNLVFQHGYGSGLLHTLTTGSLDPFVIVGVLAFAFGLSMDYEVFLLSRIKEFVDRGDPTDVAVRRGLQRTGRVITSAALLMVIVFGCFLVGRTSNTQQIGLGLASAIAIDATLVRCVLVPATMTLLGKWNWWAPRPLARWHARHFATLTPEPAPSVAPEPVPLAGVR